MQDGNSKIKYLKARAELAEQAALKQNSLQHAAAQAPPCSGAAAWGPLPTCNYGCACPSCVLCFPALFSHYSLPLQIRRTYIPGWTLALAQTRSWNYSWCSPCVLFWLAPKSPPEEGDRWGYNRFLICSDSNNLHAPRKPCLSHISSCCPLASYAKKFLFT